MRGGSFSNAFFRLYDLYVLLLHCCDAKKLFEECGVRTYKQTAIHA